MITWRSASRMLFFIFFCKVGGEVQNGVNQVKQEVLIELAGIFELFFSPYFEISTIDDLTEG